MNDEVELAALARAIVDANQYMVLGTADEAGKPWVTPVYFAPSAYREFLWVSEADARHSRNLQARGEVGIVIFDSTVPINTGQGVWMWATAQEVSAEEREEALAVYSRRTLSHGGREWTPEDVLSPAPHRLYKAVAVDQYTLDEIGDRVPVRL